MITRTFRISPEYDKLLNEEANHHGLTVSAILNQIIRLHVMFTRFTEKDPTISFSYKTFEPLLNIMPEKELIEVGNRSGSILAEEAILQHGKQLDFDSVNWVIDTIYGNYMNWFNSHESIINGNERIHLTHSFNHKWSQYLGAYMQGMFESILNSQPKIETRANSVTLYLNLPPNLKLKRIIK